ncbi:rab3 GTPase-activating protein catalytic subunit [Thalassophryne amazonica]|uniref:rab3 GTPase-activating protein catalytic subunit n=1 Tax=Thalassophryne amazonica TaxID=390379 RepID=UPI001470D27D|nr:rab3 GTPase-activating protein catalytic subunit [Thalassophryne amazonica]
MAADSEPESEVFEITDFTTASGWERFVSRIEEVLNDWQLIGSSVPKTPPGKGDYTSGTWEEKSQDINFADFEFSITHYCLKQDSEKDDEKDGQAEDGVPLAMQDLLCMNNDFPPRAHCLVRWYGMREFLVITPGTSCEAIISESKCNLLLSSISISLANSGCQVPIFVQIQQKWRRMYIGECQGPGMHTSFEMVHLRKVPSQYNHLSGLLDIFKSKIACTLTPLPPVNIAIRFTYILQDWQQYSWPQQPPDFDAVLGGEVGGVEFGKLPFGACEEPISELHLATTWPQLTEGIVVDNDVYSDLDPLQAPHWSVRVRTVENPQCLMGDSLTEFYKLCCRKESTEDVLGRTLTEEENKENGDISSALIKLTDPAPTVPISRLSVSNMVHSARKHIGRRRFTEESPLNTDILNSILLYLFPDAAVEKSPDHIKNKMEQANTGGKTKMDQDSDSSLFLQLKSVPIDSLTYRLATCVFLVNYYHSGLRAVAHLWHEFVLELRYRWENNYLIYGLASGPPDLRCCLLHQKLQMLNCCIERKRARNEARNLLDGGNEKGRLLGSCKNGRPGAESMASSTAREASPAKSWDSWSDSEEEFFECVSDQGEMEVPHAEKEKDTAKSKPEGRLHPFNKMNLLNSAVPLYVPITQEPAPMTEDLLEEQSQVLAKLGTSAEGAHLRARMQSACLLSDMESFKAANPGCVLADFLRWYSPRDFVEEETVDEKGNTVIKGELSARMKIPGNMWVETWETARATPARRQRRLFDDTKEAEKVLHYLAVMKPADVACSLLPCIIHAAILKLKEEESVEGILSVRTAIQQTTSRASKVLHQPCHEYIKSEDLIKQLMAIENIITRARSLKAKFAVGEAKKGAATEVLEKFVSSLLEEPEVMVIGACQGPAGSIIHRLFVNAQRAALLAPLEEDLDPMPRTEDGNVTGGGSNVPDFPPPAGREILLRTCVPRPAPYSTALPQRLFCVLMKDEFRLAGAFSADTSFF